MQRAIDLDGSNRRPLQRGQEHTAQRVAECDTEAAFKRFDDKLAVGIGERLLVDRNRPGANQLAPVSCNEIRARHIFSALRIKLGAVWADGIRCEESGLRL